MRAIQLSPRFVLVPKRNLRHPFHSFLVGSAIFRPRISLFGYVLATREN